MSDQIKSGTKTATTGGIDEGANALDLQRQLDKLRWQVQVLLADRDGIRGDDGDGSFAAATEYLTADFATTPTRRVRVNIAKNSQGFTTDTTVEVTAHGDETDIETEIRDLLGIADTTARDEIDLRERIDAGDAGARSREIDYA